MKKVLFLAVLVLAMTLAPVHGVVLNRGVTFLLNGTPANITWMFYYKDNMTAIAGGNYIKVGGIKMTVNPNTHILIEVFGWYPANRVQVGKTVLDFAVLANRPGSFTLTFSGLKPFSKYMFYRNGKQWKIFETDSSGTLSMFDHVVGENHYIVKLYSGGKVKGIPVVPPPAKHTPSFRAVFALLGLISVAYLLNRKKL